MKMANRKYLIAGNWKLNNGGASGLKLAADVAQASKGVSAEVVVAPPFTALAAVAHELQTARRKVHIAAQNMHFEASGAFTGEVSPSRPSSAARTSRSRPRTCIRKTAAPSPAR
jgi:triosephosphate isomerase